MFAGQIKVQNVYFLKSTYCSRASQNNLTGTIVSELVFIPNATPRRKKVLILFDQNKRLVLASEFSSQMCSLDSI